MNSERKREVWVDWMRVIACFMVMLVHSTEPFYLGGDGSLILTRADMFWASFFDSLVRCCVPLFVIASSYLQFPVHYSTGEFFRRRAVRILVPFLIWTIVYALIWGEPVQNFKDLLLNFNYAAGHLWFVYMLAGLYLIMPLLSPWAEKAGQKEILCYLALCLLTTLVPFIREAAAGDEAVVIFGPGGLPRQAEYPLWGEASWNPFGVLYYVSGFVGYMLLGLYLRKFGGRWSAGKVFAVAIPVYLAGFAITFGGFIRRVLDSCGGVFPAAGDVSQAVVWETTWGYGSLGVALMAAGLILMFRRISCQGWFYRCIILPVSKASYGMYLCHMILLAAFSGLWRGLFGIGADAAGAWATPVEIILTALCSFVCTALISVLGQKIPKIGKFIFG